MSNIYETLAGADLSAQMNVQSKIDTLTQKKEEKLARFGTQSQFTNLDPNSYTELANGLLESNGNKVWNSEDAANLQATFGDVIGKQQIYKRPDGSYYQLDDNNNEVDYNGAMRRFYQYGVKGNDDAVKFGLARGDLPSSDYRYQPGRAEAEGYNVGKNGYGWEAGDNGVDLNKKYLDVLLPEDQAIMLEGLIHGNANALENRQYPDLMTPDALTHASGVSEYYNSVEGALGDTTNAPDGANIMDKYQGDTRTYQEKRAGITTPMQSLQELLKQRESSGDYNAVNKLGYVGAYQFGAARLADLGLVKEGTKNEDLSNPEVWTGKNGADSLKTFLESKELQDITAKEHLEGLAHQLAPDAKDEKDLLGKIAAAHLLGATGSKNLDNTDANNTSGNEYYALGASAFDVEGTQSQDDMYSDLALVGSDNDRLTNLAKGAGASTMRALWGAADAAVEFTGKAAADTIRLADKDSKAADWIENKLDLGTEETKREVSNALWGYNDKYSRENMQHVQKTFNDITERIRSGNIKDKSDDTWYGELRDAQVALTDWLAENTKEVPVVNQITSVLAGINSTLNEATYDELLDVATTMIHNPETTIESLGDFAVMVLGKGKGITKLNKDIRQAKIDVVKAATPEARTKALKAVDVLEGQRKFGDKVGQMLSDNIGVLAMSASYVNDSEAEFKERYDRNKTWLERAGDMLVTSLFMNLDKSVGVLNIKGVQNVAKQISKLEEFVPKNVVAKLAHIGLSSASRLGVAGTKEFFQELTQETQQAMLSYDLVNENFEVRPVDPAEIKEITTQGLVGAFAGFAGGVHMASPAVGIGAMKDTYGAVADSVGKIGASKELKNESTELVKENNVAALPTDEEKEFMLTQINDFMDPEFKVSDTPSEQLKKLYAAEEIFNRLDTTGKDPEFRQEVEAAIGSAKQQILDNIDSWDDTASFRLGNKKEAEELVEFVLGSSKELTEQQHAKLMKIAEDNDIVEFYNNTRSYYEVEKEAVEGRRGYKGYETALKSLLRAKVVNIEALNEEVKHTQNFLASQENAVAEFEAKMAEAQRQADAANAQSLAKPKQVKVKAKQKVGTFEFTINFEKVDDKWVVAPAAKRILDAKKRNVAGLSKALVYTAKKMVERGIDNSGIEIGQDIVVPAGATEAQEKFRTKDRNTYKKWGVTKVITGSNADSKWNKDYKAVNLSKINAEEYTENDVVVLNTKVKTEGKKVKFAEEKVAELVKKAMKAGATIVLDTDMLRTKKGEKNDHGKLTSLLSKYTSKEHKYASIMTKDGTTYGAYVFKPVEIANAENESTKKAIAEKKIADKKENDAKSAYLLAVAANRISEEEIPNEVTEAALKYFHADKDSNTAKANLDKYANRVLDEEIEAGVNALHDKYKQHIEKVTKALKKDKESLKERKESIETARKQYAEAFDKKEQAAIELKESVNGVKTITNTAIKALVYNKFKEFLDNVQGTETRLAEWKNQIEAVKEGSDDSMRAWLEEQRILKTDMTKSASGKGFGVMYRGKKLEGDKDNKKPAATFSHTKTQKNSHNWVEKQALELDISNTVETGKLTVLNSDIGIDEILATSPKLNEQVDQAMKAVEKAINIKKFTDTSKKKQGAELTVQEYALTDFPAGGLLVNSDGSLNKQVVTAAVISLYGMLRNNAYMMSSKGKSWADMANMLGIEERDMNPEIANLLKDKGMLAKTAGTDIGRDIANLLGLQKIKNADVEMQRYNQVLAGLAQIAMIIGEEAGMLEATSVKQLKYAKTVLGMKDEELKAANIDPKATIPFIKLTTSWEAQLEKQSATDRYEELAGHLPVESTFRKEPLFFVSKNDIAKRLESIKNDVSNGEIPEEAKSLLKKGMETAHKVNMSMIDNLVGKNAKYIEDIKKAMGYIEIPKEGENVLDPRFKTYNELPQFKKDIQASINREIETEIKELQLLAEKIGEDENAELYFLMYYSKNGRYMYESNTVNPQSQKQLTRWIIQPAKHEVEVAFDKTTNEFTVTTKEKVNGKETEVEVNATNQYAFAFGQAFGFKVDGKPIEKTLEFVNKVYNAAKNDREMLNTLFKEMLDAKNGIRDAVEIGGVEVEIEHIAHAYQAIELLKTLLDNDGKATTSFTAEIDAKTSGFALKTGLMPILGLLDSDANVLTDKMRTALHQTGIIPEKGVSVVNKLADKLLDAYQSLASILGKKTFNAITTSDESVVSEERVSVSKNVVKTIFDVLPKMDGDKVSSALRNLFKQPFMEFNYSAGLASIRKSLATELTHTLVEKLMKDSDAYGTILLTKLGMSHAEFVEAVQNNALRDIQLSSDNINLEKYLNTVTDIMYGTKVEEIFNAEYKEAIVAQGVINQAYQAMFKAYSLFYNKEMQKLRDREGFISAGAYKKLLAQLRRKFPVIKGPLSQLDGIDDGIAIYATKTASPNDNEAGAPGSQMPLNTAWSKKHNRTNATGKEFESTVLQYEIKKFEAAMSAGSVIPIHYMDGALMAKTGNAIDGLTMIHDAIMPPIHKLFETGKKYNEAIYDLILGENRYKIIEELLSSVNRVLDDKELKEFEHELENTKVNVRLRTMEDTVGKKIDSSEVKLGDYFSTAKKEVEALNKLVDRGHRILAEEIKKNGLSISNLVAADHESMYVVQPLSTKPTKAAKKSTNDKGTVNYGFTEYFKELEKYLDREIKDVKTVDINEELVLTVDMAANTMGLETENDALGWYDPDTKTLGLPNLAKMEKLLGADNFKDIVYGQYKDQFNSKEEFDETYDETIDLLRESVFEATIKVHEKLHALVLEKLKDGSNHNVKVIKELFTRAKKLAKTRPELFKNVEKYGDGSMYWETNLDEFVSEMLSTPMLIKAMSEIDVNGRPIERTMSLLERFIQAIAKLLDKNVSFHDTLLSNVLELAKGDTKLNDATISADIQAIIDSADVSEEIKERIAEIVKGCF